MTIEVELITFLKSNLQDSPASTFDIDQELVTYLESVVQGDDDDVDVAEIVDMLEAFIPQLITVSREITIDWLILTIEDQRSKSLKVEPIEDACQGATASLKPENLELLYRSSSKSHPGDRTPHNDGLLYDSPDPKQLRQLSEMFPALDVALLERCLLDATSCLDTAIDLILSGDCQDMSLSATKPMKRRSPCHSLPCSTKDAIVERYGLVSLDSDERDCRPQLPKWEDQSKSKRYLNGQLVDTKGAKYLVVKDDEVENTGPKPTYLKPLRKYRFH